MGNIVLLDELTINKIAAGEVIERPASAIKEMIENSIDAGATAINIEIKNGGISYIRITDNGKGIKKDDLELAFERHATSKIRNADDLNIVKSMGFRGEALASIAAIANVELCSKTEDDEIGSKIVVEGGKIIEQGECACTTGTTITVRNLFFNTPVRYKFLKKDYTESGYIEDAISRLALANTNIAFKLINTGKTVIQTNGDGNINNVIFSIYGKDIAQAIIPVKDNYEDINISGVIGKPEIARSNRGNQIFFVNKRFVKDRILSSAAEKAFKEILPTGKYGFLVLNIELNPNLVDVNVHPAKLEVRFQDENLIFKAVHNAIKDTLLKVELTKSADYKDTHLETNNKPIIDSTFKEIKGKTDKFDFDIPYINKKSTMTIEEVVAEKIKKEKLENQKKLAEEDKNVKEEKNDNIIESLFMSKNKNNLNKENNTNNIENTIAVPAINNKTIKIDTINENSKDKEQKENKEHLQENSNNLVIEDNQDSNVLRENETEDNIDAGKVVTKLIEDNIEKGEKTKLNFDDMYSKIFGKSTKEIEQEEPENNLISAENIINENTSLYEDSEEYNANKKQNYKLIGIAFNTYIIIEIGKELYIIDQHSAHERILYEQIKANYYSEETKDSQLLLLPDIINLSYKEMSIVRDNIDKFEKAGFQLEEFGDNTIKLTGAPTMCVDLNTRDLFLEILEQINTVARTETLAVEEKFIITIASKAAIKRSTELSNEEINDLLEKLFSLENPFIYAGGRNVAIKMTKADLEKKFARRK